MDPATMSALWQAHFKSLASDASGMGGYAEPITPQYKKDVTQLYTAYLTSPGAQPVISEADSDEADPAQ